jgi:hypothetical protein
MRASVSIFVLLNLALGVLLGAPSSLAQHDAQFASENLAHDDWGVYDADFVWDSAEADYGDWSVEDDWASYGEYYTEDLQSGYGGAYGDYDWGTGEWSFSDWRRDIPRARLRDWDSDRYGVYESGYAWETGTIGFESWSEQSRLDWLGYADTGDQGWFNF